MPSFNAHYFFANQELDFIKKTFPDVKINESALYYGAQGPDLMYFARLAPVIMPGKSLMDVGDALHAANPTLILTAMRNYFRENPNDDIAKSFMIGFICHYTLDRNAHPFVYSIEDKISLSALIISNLLQSKLSINDYYYTEYIILSYGLKQYLLNNIILIIH